MKAQLLHGFGDVSNFKPGEIPRPEAQPGQVLIRVAASSVNPVDYKMRQNGPAFAPRLPAAKRPFPTPASDTRIRRRR